MANLSEFRFSDVNKQYPFINTGMDMFGPFYFEDKREGTQMHSVCLFTCLVLRAVHLEVCYGLTLKLLSSHDHPQICITTWIPWPHCEWQWQKIPWSQPSNEFKVPEKLQDRKRVYQTAIGSTELSVDFQPYISTTLRRSLGEADKDREKVSTNSAGQSETNTLNFPDSCDRGRGNFVLQAINWCGLQHLRWGSTYA